MPRPDQPEGVDVGLVRLRPSPRTRCRACRSPPVAATNSASSMPSALLNVTMCGMVASPTPTVPISSDSTSVIGRTRIAETAKRSSRHPAGGSAADDDDPTLTHFTHVDLSSCGPRRREPPPGPLKISRVPAPAAAAEAAAAAPGRPRSPGSPIRPRRSASPEAAEAAAAAAEAAAHRSRRARRTCRYAPNRNRRPNSW